MLWMDGWWSFVRSFTRIERCDYYAVDGGRSSVRPCGRVGLFMYSFRDGSCCVSLRHTHTHISII